MDITKALSSPQVCFFFAAKSTVLPGQLAFVVIRISDTKRKVSMHPNVGLLVVRKINLRVDDS
jgi:hypothetical protein